MKVIPMQTSEENTVYIEIEEIEVQSTNLPGGAIAEDGDANMVHRLESIGEAIAGICHSVQEKAIASLGESKPKELTLQFGIKLGGEAGFPLITKGSVEGAFQVSAKWQFN
jgi:hypothetical protein